MWIQNEWAYVDGKWVQSHEELCMVNMPTKDTVVQMVLKNWTGQQWIVMDDLILGLPESTNDYFVVFSKKVR